MIVSFQYALNKSDIATNRCMNILLGRQVQNVQSVDHHAGNNSRKRPINSLLATAPFPPNLDLRLGVKHLQLIA